MAFSKKLFSYPSLRTLKSFWKFIMKKTNLLSNTKAIRMMTLRKFAGTLPPKCKNIQNLMIHIIIFWHKLKKMYKRTVFRVIYKFKPILLNNWMKILNRMKIWKWFHYSLWLRITQLIRTMKDKRWFNNNFKNEIYLKFVRIYKTNTNLWLKTSAWKNPRKTPLTP